MRIRFLSSAVALSSLLAMLCWARPSGTTTETFDGTIDEASWRIEADDEIVADGGNPGAFLRNSSVMAAIPVVQNVTLPTEFNNFIGFYRRQGVADLAVDLNVLAAENALDERPLSLGLVSGTCELVLSEQVIPRPGVGWKTFHFNVPAWKTTMPPKWVAYGSCSGLPRDDAWNLMMNQFIDGVRFYLGDPAGSYPVQIWSLGVDNPSITYGKFGEGPS